ncbi:MAG TPA: RNA polymerase sigma factor [Flavisolibacter sp.]|nr:RNA polymerase sigma factor [Flavisolibacter sp.]
MSEELLIEGCLQLDKRCQETLYKQYYPDMLRVCLRYTKTQQEALDILNRGFLKVFTNIASYKQSGVLGAWIRRIMVNTAIDFYREKTAVEKVVPLCVGSEDELGQAFIQPEIYSRFSSQDILLLLQSLPTNYRLVFTLHAVEGYSYREIAGLMDIKENTCRWYLMEARKLLQERMKQLLLLIPQTNAYGQAAAL